ncbi:RNA methyltransferase [Nostocaceae cyanobacterium CENA369]|uniref:RNA methyltransferase n=1 Tax=Dendronalium phyllosphericum CENA369 TaxID=1725256 RepID=A0A8J7LDI0_9NOST|nr:RNA methyltransferase [Dendronalium phyllosphericum]MBH8573907.1 RNA methyltransferase [Dendronalium phyllosphericum CENA369]
MAGVNSSSHERLDVEATLTEVEKLQFNRTHRNASGLFYIEGVRNFIKVIDNSFDIEAIVFSERLLTAPLARKLVRRARRSGICCINVTPEQFRGVSHSERASGVGAIVRQRWFELHEVSPQAGLCWVAVETVRSPGNLGTLIRTSEAVGGAGFMFVKESIDPYEPDVIRASMGSIFTQKFVRTSFPALRYWVRDRSCLAIGASPDGRVDYHQFNYPQSTLLFLGEERQGLTPQQRDFCQHLVRIPMAGAVDSLNLAVAGSLLMYEVYKSRVLCI